MKSFMSVVIININLIHLNIIFFNKLIMFNFLLLNYLRCNPVYSKLGIEAPEGKRVISVVDECKCGKLQWNPNGLYLDE